MRKLAVLGCSAAALWAAFASTTPAQALGYYSCGWGCTSAAYYPVYAPPSYTSLYYGVRRARHLRQHKRMLGK